MPGLRAQLRLVLGRQRQLFRAQRAHGAERTQFRHAPALDHGHAVLVAEIADHLDRHGRPADHGLLERRELAAGLRQVIQQQHPYRGHRGGQRHLLFVEQLRDGRCVSHLGPGENELRPDHRRVVRQPPRVRVEHRDHREDRVPSRQTHRIHQRAAVSVQYRRPVAVQDAFGITRRARRVTERAGGPFVERGPVERVGVPVDERFVIGQGARHGGRHRLRRRHHDRPFHRGDLALQRRQRWQQRGIDEQQLVRGVIDDELELFREQPWIHGVQHGPHARNRVIQLEVAIVVPRQRRDAVARAHARSMQGIGQLARPAEDFAPRRAVPRIVEGDRDDFARGEIALGKPHDLRDQERRIHHQSMHGHHPPAANAGCMITLTAVALEGVRGGSTRIPCALCGRRRRGRSGGAGPIARVPRERAGWHLPVAARREWPRARR